MAESLAYIFIWWLIIETPTTEQFSFTIKIIKVFFRLHCKWVRQLFQLEVFVVSKNTSLSHIWQPLPSLICAMNSNMRNYSRICLSLEVKAQIRRVIGLFWFFSGRTQRVDHLSKRFEGENKLKSEDIAIVDDFFQIL